MDNKIILTEELKSHFLNMYFIAISDSDFDKNELNEIIKIGENKGIPLESLEELIINATDVIFKIPRDATIKIEYLYDYAKIVLADGIIEENEKKSLLNFCIKFGFEEDVSDELTDWLLQIAGANLSREQLHLEINQLLER